MHASDMPTWPTLCDDSDADLAHMPRLAHLVCLARLAHLAHLADLAKTWDFEETPVELARPRMLNLTSSSNLTRQDA
jgi:hypothetical protein